MRIATVFSGIGSPEQAAKRVYDDLELVFACEWDKYARQSFKANYDIEDKHFHKDINDLDGKPYKGKVDILIGGSPCQDFSIAGLRKGIDGHRGVLIYEYFRIIRDIEPEIFIYENVKGMLSDKGGRTIKEFVAAFREMGYHCHYEVLNTKDYGVPQNRERIFLVGFKCHEHYHNFSFAPKQKLEKSLKDILEDGVEDKYYLNDNYNFTEINRSNVKGVLSNGKWDKINESARRVYDIEKHSAALHTSGGGNTELKIKVPSATRRGRVGKQVSQTLDCACNQAVVEPMVYDDYNSNLKKDGIACTLTINCGASAPRNGQKVILPDDTQDYKIRKLTPRECFRLQDFPDTFKFVVSNTQLYKQAGNSISVNVMEMIFKQIEKSRNQSCIGGLFA